MIVWIIAAVAVLFIVLVFVTGYVKASPDTAYIISGLRKTPKVLIGKAGVKIPFFEKKDELSLQLIPIDVKTSSAVPTADYINIKVDAAVNVKISDTPDLLNLAAQNFLNRKVDYIASVAREVLEGNMREIVGKMELQEMVSDRQKFANLVKENAEPDLAAMGLDIVSFNVQNFVDDSAVIENLGVDNIVKIQKNAAISRAVSEKEIAKARAIAQKEANDAEVAAAQEIAEKKTELAIRQAELQKAPTPKRPRPTRRTASRRSSSANPLRSPRLKPTSPSRRRRSCSSRRKPRSWSSPWMPRYGKRPKPSALPASRRQTPSCTSASARRRPKSTNRNSRPRL